MKRATVEDVEVLLVENWQRRGYDVIIRGAAGTPRRHHIYRPDAPGLSQWEELDPAAPAPAPSFFLDGSMLEALAAAAVGLNPAIPPEAAALEDTRAVRDRLLTLVEVGFIAGLVDDDDANVIERLRMRP